MVILSTSAGKFGFDNVFSFVWGELIFFFHSSLLIWWYLLPIFTSACNFPFLRAFVFTFDLAVGFITLVFLFHTSLWAWRILIVITLLFWEFFITSFADAFLQESKWQGLFSVFLLIWTMQKSVWSSLISKSSIPWTNPLVTVTNAPIW